MIERILARCTAEDRGFDTPCLIWTGTTAKGYGRIESHARADRRVFATHIVAWEAEHGPVPSGHLLHHRCHEKLCCEPSHLALTTRALHPREHRKTHCKRGHSLDDAYQRKDGRRYCRQCQLDRVHARRA